MCDMTCLPHTEIVNMTGSTPPPSVSELKCRLAKAMTLAADPKRNELKALLVEVFDNDAAMCGALTANNAQPAALYSASRKDELKKQVKRMGKDTINQASNYLTPSALTVLVCMGIKRRVDSDDKLFLHALEMSADAVNDPPAHAMPNAKAANGYGWGHHKAWTPGGVLRIAQDRAPVHRRSGGRYRRNRTTGATTHPERSCRSDRPQPLASH